MIKKLLLVVLSVSLWACEELGDDIVLEGRERLEGPWTVNEESQVFKSTLTTYNAFISVDTTTNNRILIENFYGVNEGTVSAVVNERSISLPRQSFGDYEVLSGSGTINRNFNQISWSYVVDMGGIVDTAAAEYTKQ